MCLILKIGNFANEIPFPSSFFNIKEMKEVHIFLYLFLEIFFFNCKGRVMWEQILHLLILYGCSDLS